MDAQSHSASERQVYAASTGPTRAGWNRPGSQDGDTLHTWRSQAEGGITSAELVNRPAGSGGSKLVILGFTEKDRSALQGSLSAFDIHGDMDEPIWSRRVETKDLLPELLDNDYTGQQFSANLVEAVDIFTEYPGSEIVVTFTHSPKSPTVIRIYDLKGELMFQLWQDGGVGSSYWMSDAELLVFTALDAQVYWDERGFRHPRRHG